LQKKSLDFCANREKCGQAGEKAQKAVALNGNSAMILQGKTG